MNERKYLPTIAELIDRLSIVLMKSIFIEAHRVEYREEMALIKYDLDSALQSENSKLFAHSDYVYLILIVMLTNRFIWENEAAVRRDGVNAAGQLYVTHSINGVRNRAKNMISAYLAQRTDEKTDCLAADLPKEFGNWNVFE